MTKVELFDEGFKSAAKKYEKWIIKNPHIKIISTTYAKEWLVVTYEE
ncbi:hypothetical protein [Salipaludibacillus neizhouensis]|nr:hypothetical protein [Salipaludibacillus neizhouensis]